MKPSFDDVVTKHKNSILHLCTRLLVNPADAADAAQESLIAIHSALPDFRGRCQLSTWVYRITLNVCLRIRQRQSQRSQPLEPLHNQIPDTKASLDEHVAARQEAQKLSAAMSTLSDEHRVVLSLFALDGLSHKEIADILAIPEGTVWSRLHLARKKLIANLT